MRIAATMIAVLGLAAGALGARAQDVQPKAAAGKAAAAKEAVKAIAVVGAWARATPGAAKTGAVYLEIKSPADVEDKLLSAASAVADAVEIHNHINDNGIMQMRRVEFVELAEGSTKFVPGGYHIMMIGLKQPLKAGETFKIKLTFEKAGAIDADVAVRANSAAHGKGSGSGSGAH